MGRVSSKTSRSAGKARGDSLKAKQASKVTKKPARPVATVVARAAPADRFERQMRKEVKRQALISALEDTGRRRKEEAEKKRRAARPVVGDLNPMADSIRDILDQVEKEDEARSLDAAAAGKNKAKKGGTKKERRRKKDFLASVRAFGSVLRDEEFKKDPLAAITAHVHHKVESQEL